MLALNMELGDPLERDWIIRTRKSISGGMTYSQISATSTVKSGAQDMVRQMKLLNNKSLAKGNSTDALLQGQL